MNAEEQELRMQASYFRGRTDYFWRWADGGRVIEHQDGTTICYRQELENVLEALNPEGWVPLMLIILVMDATRDNYPDSPIGGSGYYKIFGTATPSEREFAAQASKFMDMLSRLPKMYRVASGMLHLMKTLFNVEVDNWAGSGSAELLYPFQSGALDAHYLEPYEVPEGDNLLPKRTLQHFVAISEEFDSLEALLSKLETGLPEPPKPAEVPIPEIQPPDGSASALLEELLQDPRTSGLAHLARSLVAALHIPMQARRSGELPLGGVSDITNRGNYDRLLLSELANDDLTLMARLSNSEALFLRREEPPVKIEKERVVLLDTTIRLWGMNRAYAVSVALACQERNLPGNAFSAYALGGRHYAPVDLSSKDGVIATMSLLDASLHAAEGLDRCLQALPKGDHEIIFITAAELLADPAFNAVVIAVQPQLDYLVTVARDGHMQLIEVMHGRRRLLSEAQLDLQDLLFRRPQNRPIPSKYDTAEVPAFVSAKRAPLYFPATSIRLRPNNTKIMHFYSILVITDHRRLLYWSNEAHGAREVAPFLAPSSDLKMQVFAGLHAVVVAPASGQNKLKVDVYDMSQDLSWHVNLDCEVWQNVYYAKPYLYYYKLVPETFKRELKRMNFVTGEEEPSTEDVSAMKGSIVGSPQAGNYTLHDLKKIVNPGYSTLQQAKSVRIDMDGNLEVDGRSLECDPKGNAEFVNRSVKMGETAQIERSGQGLALPNNAQLKLRRMQWKDGSVGFLDPRGFLHLRSSDPKLPEITIVLIVGKPTTLWVSNGVYAGSKYFINSSKKEECISCSDFVTMFLRPFAQRIFRKS